MKILYKVILGIIIYFIIINLITNFVMIQLKRDLNKVIDNEIRKQASELLKEEIIKQLK